jgi:mRNA interferase RelE/StbE
VIYTVELTATARKEFLDLPKLIASRIETALDVLAQQPRPSGCKKLKGRDGWRLRVGDYRILYQIADTVRVITVQRIAHRKESYR